MKTIDYLIGGKTVTVSIEGAPEFRYGDDEILSRSDTDICFGQDWYEEGFTTFDFLKPDEFEQLRSGLTDCVKRVIESELNLQLETFELEKYHHAVTTDEDHFKVVSRTRDLFPEDFNFPIFGILKRLEAYLGFELTDLNPHIGERIHIIIRINRPNSTDYNPPHKDNYDDQREGDAIWKFINLWIPVCGVTDKSSLPIAPSTHLLKESEILRTFEGGLLNNNKYRVVSIKEWGGSNELERARVKYGEALLFSSHLVHGLAVNEEDDTTRVSLEFRLFRKEP